MASKEFLATRALAATKCTRRVNEATGVVLRIKHVGTGTTQTPTVVISNTSTTLTLTDAAAAATAIDFASAYTTVGAVADYINSLSSWKCKIMDGLRADASDNLMANGSVTSASINGETVFDLLQLIASAKLEVRVTYDETVGNLRPAGAHRVTLNAFSTYATATGGANCVRIYDCNNSTKAETQIWGGLLTNNTLQAYSAFSTGFPFSGITATEGHDLVIVITGTVTTAATTNYVQAEFTRE